jgi:hypothetical protein
VVGAKLKGDGVVEWVDEALEVVHSEAVKVKAKGFTVDLSPALAVRLAGGSGIRVWALDRRSGYDAVGWWSAPADDTASGVEQPAPPDELPVAEVE